MADATIRDVATRANVSVATVSRVLNRLENVSAETRARVAEAVEALGYVPHAAARSLSLARTHTIGVVLPDLHGEFFSELARGLDRAAREKGYLLLLSSLHDDSRQAAQALRAMRGRVDGLIVMAPNLLEAELEQALSPRIPTLLINSRVHREDLIGIRIDNAAGSKAIAAHLAAIGCRQIVHVAGPAGNIDTDERRAAFCSAIEAIGGIEVAVVQGQFDEASGQSAIASLIEAGHRFDGVFAANDEMAIGALQALRSAGLSVPGQVAVAGFDDIPLARHLELTTINVRIAELGHLALTRLVGVCEGSAASTDALAAPELVIRRSTRREGYA